MSTLPNDFENFLLQNQKVSQKTIRNYRSDLAHFVEWSTFETVEELVKNFTANLVGQYKGWHMENKIPPATTNRRLSTLRNFAKFLKSNNLLFSNPTEIIENLKHNEASVEEKLNQVLFEYKKSLLEQGVSKSTLKNYLSDTRQFLAFAMQEAGR